LRPAFLSPSNAWGLQMSALSQASLTPHSPGDLVDQMTVDVDQRIAVPAVDDVVIEDFVVEGARSCGSYGHRSVLYGLVDWKDGCTLGGEMMEQ
jgi:hypothetical protein